MISSETHVQELSLDFVMDKIKTVTLKQYNEDSQAIVVTITDEGKKFELKPSAHTILFKMTTPDGRQISNYGEIDVEDNTVIIPIVKQCCTYPGRGEAEVIVFDASEYSRIATMNFYVVVKNSPYSDEDIINSSYYADFSTQINKVMEAVNKAIAADTSDEVKENALLAKSYAIGESEIRDGEETDNSKYYSQLSKSYAIGNTGLEGRENEDTDNAEYYCLEAKNSEVNAFSAANQSQDYSNDSKTYSEEAKNYRDEAQQIKDAVDSITQSQQSANSDDSEYPILFSNTSAPLDGGFTGTYFNTGISINPNKKSITIGSAVLTYDETDEKKLTISFN